MKMILRTGLDAPKTITKLFAEIVALETALSEKRGKLALTAAEFYANARVEKWTVTQIKDSIQKAYCNALGVHIDTLNFPPRPSDEDQTSYSKWSRLWRVIALAGENTEFREELSGHRSFNSMLKRSKEFKPTAHKSRVAPAKVAVKTFSQKVAKLIAEGIDTGLTKAQMQAEWGNLMSDLED